MGSFQDFVTQNPLKCFIAGRATAGRRAMTEAYQKATELEHSRPADVLKYQERALRQLPTLGLRGFRRDDTERSIG